MAIRDLQAALEAGETIEQAAVYLCRATSIDEVQNKGRELGSPIRSNEPRRIDVVYADGHWLAGIAGDFDSEFDCARLMQCSLPCVKSSKTKLSYSSSIDQLSMVMKTPRRNSLTRAKKAARS